MAFLVLGLLVGVLLGQERRFLTSRYLWLGVLACLAISLPNLLWQLRNHFPLLELLHNIRMTNRDVVRGPIAFIANQAFVMHPLLFPLWAGGLLWLFFAHEGRRYRVLGWTFLVTLSVFIFLKAKFYYVVPIYPMLFAAGAIGLERITARRKIGTPVRIAYTALVVISGAALAPLSAPILSPEGFLRYQKTLALHPPTAQTHNHTPLPQYFAAAFGWQEMVREVARIYNSLPTEEQVRTAIFSNSWESAVRHIFSLS